MKLTIIPTGRFKLDGGAMFGVVPKRMWSAMNTPDDNNMCTWAMNALLVETAGRKILIDTGLGNKQDAKFQSHFEPHGEESLFGSLALHDHSRESITDVFLTHLHFDHCGGAVWHNEKTGKNELAFPNATYWSNQRHFDWAMQPNERERASFLKENFVPLQESGRLKMIPVKQNYEFLPGFRVGFVYGHTEAMMLPVLTVGKRKILYCADLMPSHWHVGIPYVMAYDIRPLKTLKEKEKLLRAAARSNAILIMEHDPAAEAITVVQNEKGRIGVEKQGKLSELLLV